MVYLNIVFQIPSFKNNVYIEIETNEVNYENTKHFLCVIENGKTSGRIDNRYRGHLAVVYTEVKRLSLISLIKYVTNVVTCFEFSDTFRSILRGLVTMVPDLGAKKFESWYQLT